MAFSEITLPAVREEFEQLREWLETVAGNLAVPAPDIQRLLIAADEIFTNIACYAYPGQNGSVKIQVESADSNAIKVHFFDTGIPFNPLTQSPPDVNAPLAERKIGGLGIAVVKKLMDLVEYEYKGGANRLTLTKRFAPAAEVQHE